MNKMFHFLVLSSLLIVSLFMQKIANATTYATIGTGGVTGVYYPAGGAIQRMVSAGTKDHGVRLAVESTGGSVFNLNALRNGELDLGVAQSDTHYKAYTGQGDAFKDKGPFTDLRSVFSLHSEAVTVVARANANIVNFEDLVGKRFNLGNPGSGQRNVMNTLMDAYGWTKDTFSIASELKSSESSSALCDGNIDAYIFIAGHPAPAFKEATTTCDARIVTLTGPKVETLINEHSYYAPATIPGGMYKGNPDDVKTFGMKATIVSSTKTSEDVIYHIVKAVFENLDSFRKFHPAFAYLKKEEMVSGGLSAPLHPGAAKYYKEIGLIK